jgi:hypothetical protein
MCDKWGIHHIYQLFDKTQDTLIAKIQEFLNLIWRQWKSLVRFFIMDNEQGLVEGDEFKVLIADEGIQIKISPPDVHDANGTIERAGGGGVDKSSYSTQTIRQLT